MDFAVACAQPLMIVVPEQTKMKRETFPGSRHCFEASSLAGQSSSVIEGGAKTFTVYLNQAAQAGETLTLSLGALADKFKALITPPGSTPSVVNAQGAVITLVAGQTQASFVLLQQGAVSANASACNDAQWELRA